MKPCVLFACQDLGGKSVLVEQNNRALGQQTNPEFNDLRVEKGRDYRKWLQAAGLSILEYELQNKLTSANYRFMLYMNVNRTNLMLRLCTIP